MSLEKSVHIKLGYLDILFCGFQEPTHTSFPGYQISVVLLEDLALNDLWGSIRLSAGRRSRASGWVRRDVHVDHDG